MGAVVCENDRRRDCGALRGSKGHGWALEFAVPVVARVSVRDLWRARTQGKLHFVQAVPGMQGEEGEVSGNNQGPAGGVAGALWSAGIAAPCDGGATVLLAADGSVDGWGA